MKKIHRFIIEYSIDNKEIEIVDPQLLHQWKNVLKLEQGEKIILANKELGETLCTLETLEAQSAKCTVVETRPVVSKPAKEVILYMAILKNENFELVVQKASEIGVAKIVPTITARTIKTGLKRDRLIKIATEASELAGRIDVPEITEPVVYTEALNESKQYSKRIICDASGEKFQSETSATLALFIGPEGGFTDEELHHAKEHGCNIASLGQNTLRGETAGIIASYLAVNL